MTYDFRNRLHEFRVADDWHGELGDPRCGEQRYLVFVDQGRTIRGLMPRRMRMELANRAGRGRS